MMTADQTPNPNQRQTFVLRPHRSLSPRGFLILMSVYGALSFAAGVAFYRMGAWPVLGFCGLDVLLVYWAFRANYRSARQTETIEVTPGALTVRACDPHGCERAATFNPYWLRVELKELAGNVCELRLTSKGRGVAVGRFLSDPERRDLALALREAISRSKEAPIGEMASS
jgi:uncharacterized membrane protein